MEVSACPQRMMPNDVCGGLAIQGVLPARSGQVCFRETWLRCWLSWGEVLSAVSTTAEGNCGRWPESVRRIDAACT